MSPKLLFLCLQICLIKSALSQCFGSKSAAIAESLGLFGAASVGPAGGPLLLQNFPMPTPGLSIVADELVIEGLVSVSGRLPFIGTVALEGVLPTEGQGTVLYGCGNGEIGIAGEGTGTNGPSFAPTFPGPALAGTAFPGPLSPAPFAPFTGPCSSLVPQIDPGMAAAANTAAMAAAASASGQAAVTTTLGIGAAANAAGLNAITGL